MIKSFPHTLGSDQAKIAVDNIFAHYALQFPQHVPTLSWITECKANISFRASLTTLTGTLEIRSTNIDFDIKIPFLLRPFQHQFFNTIAQELSIWTKKIEAGDV